MTGEEMLGWRRERFRRDDRIVDRKGKLPFLEISIERVAFQMKDVMLCVKEAYKAKFLCRGDVM